MLELLQHRPTADLPCRGEQPERDTGDGGVHTRLEGRQPHGHADDDVGPDVDHSDAAQDGHEAEQADGCGQPRQGHGLRVHHGDDPDGQDVVDDRDRQQQQFGPARHPVAEQSEHADREGDVGRHRDPPAPRTRTAADQAQEQQRRQHDPTERSDRRQRRRPRVAQFSRDDLALDLQTYDEEEQHHQGVVHPVPQVLDEGEPAYPQSQLDVPDRLIEVSRRTVRPDHRHQRSSHQHDAAGRLHAQEGPQRGPRSPLAAGAAARSVPSNTSHRWTSWVNGGRPVGAPHVERPRSVRWSSSRSGGGRLWAGAFSAGRAPHLSGRSAPVGVRPEDREGSSHGAAALGGPVAPRHAATTVRGPAAGDGPRPHHGGRPRRHLRQLQSGPRALRGRPERWHPDGRTRVGRRPARRSLATEGRRRPAGSGAFSGALLYSTRPRCAGASSSCWGLVLFGTLRYRQVADLTGTSTGLISVTCSTALARLADRRS